MTAYEIRAFIDEAIKTALKFNAQAAPKQPLEAAKLKLLGEIAAQLAEINERQRIAGTR